MITKIFSTILLAHAVLALYQAISTWSSNNRTQQMKRLTSLLTIASSIWSFCFGLLFLMDTLSAARICRGIGLIGVIMYLLAAEILIGELSTLKKGFKHFCYLFGASGFILIPFISSEYGAIYYMTENGIAFTMPQTLPNTLYSVYCVLISIIIFFFIVNIIRTAGTKRLKLFGYGFISVGIIIVGGMVADTILPPLTGIDSLPASSIVQFWGVAMVLIILAIHERSNISIDNMSNFIYYSLSVPVILYDPFLNPCISNDAVFSFLEKDRLLTGNSELTLDAMFGIPTKAITESKEDHIIFEKKCNSNGKDCHITVDAIKDRFKDILGYIVNINDISSHKTALEKIEEARAIAEASNHSKSVFLSNVSHEIRTPMNSIVGFTELLLNSDLNSEGKEYVSDIKRASNALLAIINSVLDLSKIEDNSLELENEEFSTVDLFQDICRIVEPTITVKDVIFKTNIDEKLPSVLRGDRKRIQEIITNLLGNASRNTSFGSVSLKIEHRRMLDNDINLHIEVQDTSYGLTPEETSTIFDAFSQKNNYLNHDSESTGLELTLTKKYVDYMNGQIHVVSKNKYGSNFIVDIPLAVADFAPIGVRKWGEADSLASSLGNTNYNNLKVLIVDDSKINVKVFSHILKTYGIDADYVYSGKASLDLCAEKEYDIIFMDQMMPEMDGIEAMKHIRLISNHYAAGSSCQIIAFTANAVEGVSEELIKEGFDAYMSKPIDLELLEAILNRI